jgi:AcrR family transcriptional regulator
MASLAAHLGVRTPALYHYFVGLAGLRRALALKSLQEASAKMGRVVMGKAGDAAVLALAHTLRDFAEEHPGLYTAASRAPDPEDSVWQEAGREAVEIMMRSLSSYQLSPDDARRVVLMARGIVHGCVSLEHIGGFGPVLQADETFHSLLDALLDYVHNHLQANV